MSDLPSAPKMQLLRADEDEFSASILNNLELDSILRWSAVAFLSIQPLSQLVRTHKEDE